MLVPFALALVLIPGWARGPDTGQHDDTVGNRLALSLAGPSYARRRRPGSFREGPLRCPARRARRALSRRGGKESRSSAPRGRAAAGFAPADSSAARDAEGLGPVLRPGVHPGIF